jgi:hypothetical protein
MRPWFIACCIIALILPGCIPFSSFQSARIVNPHESQGVLSVSRLNYGTHEGERDYWTCVDARGRVGMGARFDGGFGMTMFWHSSSPDPEGAFGGDLRYGVWPDHLAVVLPISFFVSTLEIAPGLVLTVPIHDRWDISVAARRHLFVQAPEERAIWSYNLGLGIPIPRSRWTIRPEVGWLFLASANHLYPQAGIGLETPTN